MDVMERFESKLPNLAFFLGFDLVGMVPGGDGHLLVTSEPQ